MAKTKIDINRVAKLANLDLADGEKNKYEIQLANILGYIDQIEDKLKNLKVEPKFNASKNTNITRSDTVSKSLTQDQALKNASKSKDGFFATKGVFDND